MIGFVDDCNNCVNYFKNAIQHPNVLLEKAQEDAQLWNDLLYCSGGALEVRKCMFQFAHYVFSSTGALVLQPLPQTTANSITVKESGLHGQEVPIV